MQMRLKMSSARWRPFCRGLNVLRADNITRTNQSATKRVYVYGARSKVLLDGLTPRGWMCMSQRLTVMNMATVGIRGTFDVIIGSPRAVWTLFHWEFDM